MSAPTDALRAPLERGLDALGLAGDAERIPALLGYLEQLARWNRTYNLTAVRDPQAMLSHHLLDCLSILPPLREAANGRAIRVADIGSGAGLPGIILAICEPSWSVVCVDAVAKKVAFMRQVSGLLRLGNVRVEHARVADLAPLQADVVISRAFASLTDFVRQTAKHCAPSGALWAMKGKWPEDECVALARDTPWGVAQRHVLQVPGLDAQRCLLKLRLKESP